MLYAKLYDNEYKKSAKKKEEFFYKIQTDAFNIDKDNQRRFNAMTKKAKETMIPVFKKIEQQDKLFKTNLEKELTPYEKQAIQAKSKKKLFQCMIQFSLYSFIHSYFLIGENKSHKSVRY